MPQLDDLAILRKAPFAALVENLEQLISQGDRAFLIGAGCSKCAGLPLTSELTEQVEAKTAGKTKEITSRIVADFAGANGATIEEYMSELVDRIAIASRRAQQGANHVDIVIGGKQFTEADLTTALEEMKVAIAKCIEDKQISIGTHWQFVRAVHRVLRPGKQSRSEPVNYLVLNYDSLVEDALALERIPYSDGFVGGATGWWDPERLSEDGLSARVLKLHGSIDWTVFKDEANPRRIRPSLAKSEGMLREKLLIWPAATKYRETERDPFAQIAKFMRDVLRADANSDVVLTTCGYRFGDAHINAELYRALKESKKRLTLLAFTSAASPDGVLKLWHEDPALRDQIRIHAKNGFFHTVDIESGDDLPWWKFEVLTRLLGGER